MLLLAVVLVDYDRVALSVAHGESFVERKGVEGLAGCLVDFRRVGEHLAAGTHLANCNSRLLEVLAVGQDHRYA